MKKLWIVVGALLVIGAVELALLTAGAAGPVGGKHDSLPTLPPVNERSAAAVPGASGQASSANGPALPESPPVSPPPGPNRFFGNVTVNGLPASPGTDVTATIVGVVSPPESPPESPPVSPPNVCGQTTVDADSTYVLDVVSSEETGGCGTEGATVNFTVGGCPAGSATWHSGAFTELDLAATCSPPPSPPVNDADGDGVPDNVDNCPSVSNADQLNTDSACIPNGADIVGDCRANPDKDGEGDACDLDDDNDDLTDAQEAVGCGSFGPTDPLKKDTDGDGAIDGYECQMGTDPNNPADRPHCAGHTDTDGDGIFDCVEEMGYGTSPLSTDTDGDSSGNDGCQDDKQIVDVNGDGKANVLDVFAVARIALVPGSYDPLSQTAADIDKDGANTILDVFIAAKNSDLVEPHATCR